VGAEAEVADPVRLIGGVVTRRHCAAEARAGQNQANFTEAVLRRSSTPTGKIFFNQRQGSSIRFEAPAAGSANKVMSVVAASVEVFHSAATSLRFVAQAANGLIGLRDEPKIHAQVKELNSAVVEAYSRALAVQTAALAQASRIHELEERIVKLENWEREKQRYELSRLNPGVLVYSLKPSQANGEPHHDICATCYQDGIKSILQPEHSIAGIKLCCTRCTSEITHW